MLHKGGGNTTCTGAGEEEEGMGSDGILEETDCRVKTVKTVFLRILIFLVKMESGLEFQVTYLFELRRQG